MRYKLETFVGYADECDRRAKAAAGRPLEGLFRDLARQWRELAVTVALLEADAKATKDLYKYSPHIRTPLENTATFRTAPALGTGRADDSPIA
jgi:hypothetical protein